jgi:hypothetical protein
MRVEEPMTSPPAASESLAAGWWTVFRLQGASKTRSSAKGGRALRPNRRGARCNLRVPARCGADRGSGLGMKPGLLPPTLDSRRSKQERHL